MGMPFPNDDQDGLRRRRDCGEWKPFDAFHVNPRRPSGRGSYCQPCFNVRSKASYAKRVRESHGREVRQPREVPEGHRYCPDCQVVKPLTNFPQNQSGRKGHGRYGKPCHNVRTQANREKNYGCTREYHLRYRYGIGVDEFRQLLAAQGGVCAICGTEQPERVDHDHRTGYIRGILCSNCHAGLGKFRDNVWYMERAATYLMVTNSRVDEAPGVFRIRTPDRGMFPARRAGARRRAAQTSLAVD